LPIVNEENLTVPKVDHGFPTFEIRVAEKSYFTGKIFLPTGS
jgi:hypothetical protein